MVSNGTNQLKIGIILSYVSTALNMLVQLLYTPIMIRLLGQSEYGLYTLVGSVVSYLSLFSLGFTGAYLRFSTRCEYDEDDSALPRLNGMFVSLFVCMSIVALVAGMTLSQFTSQLFGSNLTADELNKAKMLMQILVVNIALSFPSSIFDAMISANEKFLFQRLVVLLGTIFNPLLCLPLLLMGYGSVAVVTVTTIITTVKLAINVWYCLCKLKIPFIFRNFNFSVLKEIACFSFFLFLNMIIDQINLSVGKLILGRVSGTASVAIYGVGAQINSLFYMFSTTVSSVFSPRVNRIAASTEGKSRDNEFTQLFIKVGRIQFLILALVLLGFIVFGYYFVTEIYSTIEYADAYSVSLLLMIPAIVPLIQNIGVEVQRSRNKHQFRSVVYFFMAVVNLLISIPLAYYAGPVGAAIGTSVSLLLANGIVMNIYYHKCLGIDIVQFWMNILRLMRGALIPTILGIFIIRFVRFESFGEYFIYILLFSFVYCFSMWLLGMNNYEKNLVRRAFAKLFRRGVKG